MNTLALLERIGLAAMIGLLIGIERGWQLRGEQDGQRVAGVRTFTLTGLAGGVAAALSQSTAPLVLAFSALGFAGGFAAFELRRARDIESYSATNLVAAIATFLIGAFAVAGNMTAAAAAGVVVTLVLAERQILHSFLNKLTWPELRAGLLLLVMSVVLLPLLPDRTIDPWNALNLHQIWTMTVLVAAIDFAGYAGMRLAGEKRGLLYAAMTGGLVSSTTVTWTFARMARATPSTRDGVLSAVLASWVVSLLRMTAIALAIAPSLSGFLLPPVLAAVCVLTLPAGAFYLRDGHGDGELPIRNPLDLTVALKFGALLAAIMLLSKLALTFLGDKGLSALGALSGLLDVDPITLSMAESVRSGLAAPAAVGAILSAALANGVAKAALGSWFGGWRLGAVLTASLAAATAAAAAVLLLR